MTIVAVTMPEIDVLINPPTIDGFWQMIGRAHAVPWQMTATPRMTWKPITPPKPQEYR